MSSITEKKYSILTVMVAATVFLMVGLMLNHGTPAANAGEVQKKIQLGMPAAQVISILGHPVKISADEAIQQWYFKGPKDTVVRKVMINQGMVVRIF